MFSIVVGYLLIVFLTLVVGALVFDSVRDWLRTRRDERAMSRVACQRNLHHLGVVLTNWRMDTVGEPPFSGPSLFLFFRQNGAILTGDEEIFICPNDPQVTWPDTPRQMKRYEEIDLDSPPRDACSYAVRDFERFPLVPDADQLQFIAACPNHDDGVVALRVDGAYHRRLALFIPRDRLGIAEGAPIVIGPASTHPELRTLVFAGSRDSVEAEER